MRHFKRIINSRFLTIYFHREVAPVPPPLSFMVKNPFAVSGRR